MEPVFDLGAIETRRPGFRCRQRHLIVLGGQLAFSQLIEADRDVEDEIGVLRVGGVGLEIGLLRLAPAPLSGIEVAECEQDRCRTRLFREGDFQPAFGSLCIGQPLRAGDAGRAVGCVGSDSSARK